MKIRDETIGTRIRRVLEIDGERISWLSIHPRDVRIGPAVVKSAGIAGVGTHWHHRMKGHARAMMEDTVEFLKAEGCLVVILHGIRRFYHKFGFAPCMTQVTATVKTRDAESHLAPDPRFSLRPFDETDLPGVLDLYNTNNARRTLTVVRTPERFTQYRHASTFHRTPEIYVVEDAGGTFAGYALTDAFPDPTTLSEAETTDPAALSSVLAKLVEVAIERRDGEITIKLPSRHPLMAMLRPVGCRIEKTYKNDAGPMGRIINQDALLEKLSRAYAAEPPGAAGAPVLRVTVETDLASTTVPVPAESSGGASLKIPSTTLFQTIAGFRRPEEVLLSPGVEARDGGEALLDFLHPGHEPYMYGPDHV